MVKVKLDCLDPLEIGGTCFLKWVRVQVGVGSWALCDFINWLGCK